MNIAILGLGRLGRSLVPLLEQAGHNVQTWTRDQAFPNCDVAWIMVRDEAVAEVAGALPPGPIVLHASGSLGLEVLQPHSPAGSLHLLQSFPGPEVGVPPLRGVPAAVSGDPAAVECAKKIASSLGLNAVHVPGDRRLYHAAAVMAGNFATTLLGEGAKALQQAGVSKDMACEMLAPLALASIQQAAIRGPAAALTGPFPRGDAATIEGHLQALQAVLPDLVPLYTELGKRTIRTLSDGTELKPEDAARLFRSLE
ncbi:MAG: DUF2520 domain-containing protein [Myxococcota bacterium]|nr:DUF2520 domain-containing protein [Myxococcota bacterium]